VSRKKLTNVGSNAVQGQPSRLQGFANILQNIVSAKESQDSCIANVDVRKTEVELIVSGSSTSNARTSSTSVLILT
jgi:hypothetical protein